MTQPQRLASAVAPADQGDARLLASPARRPVPLTADCQLAVAEDWPQAHRRCRGNGALRLPAFRTPVLPAEPCGCSCHTQGGGAA